MAQELDEAVEAFRTRPLDAGPYTFVAADALVLKLRENGPRRGRAHPDRRRRQRRGPSGDPGHPGQLRRGRGRLAGVLPRPGRPGRRWSPATPTPAWQRCRTHYAVNLMSATPKSSWPWVRTLPHSVFDQPDAESVVAQYDRILDAPTDKLPEVAEHLDAARPDLLAFTAFPKQIWRQIWSNNPQERLNRISVEPYSMPPDHELRRWRCPFVHVVDHAVNLPSGNRQHDSRSGKLRGQVLTVRPRSPIDKPALMRLGLEPQARCESGGVCWHPTLVRTVFSVIARLPPDRDTGQIIRIGDDMALSRQVRGIADGSHSTRLVQNESRRPDGS